MVEIRIEKTIAVEPMRVWEVLADHEGMPKWINVREVIRRRPGVPDPNGVGAIRTLRGSGIVMEERITAFEPGQRMAYTVIKGAPGWDPRGEITLSPTPSGGTVVRWNVTVRPYIPGTGWLIYWFLRSTLEQGLQRLKERLEPADISEIAQDERDRLKGRVDPILDASARPQATAV